jgi:hypothetical protein
MAGRQPKSQQQEVHSPNIHSQSLLLPALTEKKEMGEISLNGINDGSIFQSNPSFLFVHLFLTIFVVILYFGGREM